MFIYMYMYMYIYIFMRVDGLRVNHRRAQPEQKFGAAGQGQVKLPRSIHTYNIVR